MRFQNSRGISKILFTLCLILTLIVGAVLSYLWTMGYYASQQYQIPKNPALSIESVEFPEQNTTFFNIVVLNPSYSSGKVSIEQLMVLTENSQLHDVNLSPALPFSLDVGKSQSFKGDWNWANYTGQEVKIIVFVSEGSGPTTTRLLPYVGLTVEARFNSTITERFNVTVRNLGESATYVNITGITLNHESPQSVKIGDENVSFPYPLNINESVTFTCVLNWTTYQGKEVIVAVKTLQGYMATWQGKV